MVGFCFIPSLMRLNKVKQLKQHYQIKLNICLTFSLTIENEILKFCHDCLTLNCHYIMIKRSFPDKNPVGINFVVKS